MNELDNKITTLSNKNDGISKYLISNQNQNKILTELDKDKQVLKMELGKLSNTIKEFNIKFEQKFNELNEKIENINICRRNDRGGGGDDDDDDDDDDDYDEDYDDDEENGENYRLQSKLNFQCEKLNSFFAVFVDENVNDVPSLSLFKPITTDQRPLNELFMKSKQEKNLWTCNICAVPNDDNVSNCVSCESPRYPSENQVVKNLFASPVTQSPQQQQTSSFFGQTNATANTTFKFGSLTFSDSKNTNDSSNSTSRNIGDINVNNQTISFKPANCSGSLFGFTTTSATTSMTKTNDSFSFGGGSFFSLPKNDNENSSLTTTTSQMVGINNPDLIIGSTANTGILNKPILSAMISSTTTVAPTKSSFSLASNSSNDTKTTIIPPVSFVNSNFSFNAASLNVPNPTVSASLLFPSQTTPSSNANLDVSTSASSPFSSAFQFGNISNQFPTFNNLGQQQQQQQQQANQLLSSSTPGKAQNSGLFSFSNNMNLGQNTVLFSPPKLDSNNPPQLQHLNDEHDQSGGGEDLILPKVNLPENYEHITGEEDELEIYCMKRAKLYVFAAPEYKERGTGELKILKHKITKKLRMVMRRDQVHTVCLNTLLTKESKFDEKPKHVLFQCIDFSDNKPDPQTFALRSRDLKEFLQFINETLATADTAEDEENKLPQTNITVTDKFCTDIEEKISKEKVVYSSPEQKSSNDSNDDDKDIEIVFVREPKPEHLQIIDSLKLPKNFFIYEEKEPCKGCIGCQVDELCWNDLTCDSLLNTADHKEQQQQNAQSNSTWTTSNGLFSGLTDNVQTEKIDTIKLNKDPHEWETEAQSFVSEKSKMLPDNYVHITGEEDEETVYKERAKLYRYVKDTNEFKERGVGEMKILRKRDTGN